MRIANVIEEGKLGGPQVRMVRVAAAFGDMAETLVVMPRTNSGHFREMCDANGVRYRAMPLTRITKEWRAALAYVIFSPFEVFHLARLFRCEKVDLVHASGGSWQYKAVVAARLAGVPVVWHLNDTQMPRWVRAMFQLLQPLASGFIFASERSRAYYQRRLNNDPRPQYVVPSTVDISEFSPDHPAAGKAGGLWPSEQVVGVVANISPIKGLEVFIRAMARLQQQGRPVRAVVVGPVYDNQKSYFAKLQMLAQQRGLKRLDWVGALKDVRPMLGRFDVCVCSSLAESSPLSIWEAMAMTKAVVSTDVGDVALHVIDGESGYIVPVGDDAALATRVAELLDNPEHAAAIGARARANASNFTPSTIAGLTLRAYHAVHGSAGF